MAVSETARLIASLELKDQFTPGVNKALGGLGKLDAGISRTQSRANRAGQQVGTGIKRTAAIAAGAIGFLAANVAVGLKALVELESVTAQTNAVLKSTKGVAGQTAGSIRDLAEKYEALNATIDDKVIQSAENVLLTFTAIRKEGFEPAIAAALDMSTALGTDLQGSVIQIGKALQDPIKGITALRRVGVNFSTDQIKVIKALVDTGDVLGAQKVILAELNTEFGGSFLAGGNTTAGKVAKFKDSIEDLQKTLATALLPAIGKVADGLSKFLADPAIIKGANDLGQSIASMFSDANLKSGADFLKDAFETAKSAAPVVAQAAKTTFGFVQGAVGLFRTLPKEIQALAIGGFAVNKLTGGLVTNIAGGIIDVVGKNFLQRGGTPANPLFVSAVGGLGAVPGGAPLASKLNSVAAAVGKVFLIGAAVGVFAELTNVLGDQTKANKQQAAGLNEQTSLYVKSASIDQMKASLAALKDTSGYSLAEQLALNLNIDGVRDTIIAQQAQLEQAIAKAETAAANGTTVAVKALSGLLDRGGRETGRSAPPSTLLDRGGRETGRALLSVGQLLSKEFREAVAGLKTAIKPTDIAAAVKRALATVVTGGRGSVSSTKGVLADLKGQLAKTHDAKTAAILRAAIHQVERKIPGREFAQRQIAKADALLRDGKITNQDLRKIQSIEQALKDRGLPSAANKISARVDAAKAKIAAAARDAGRDAALATKNKKTTTTVNVKVNNSVTLRDVTRARTTFKTISGFTQS